MAEGADNLVLEHLRAIRSRLEAIDGRIDDLSEKIDDLKVGQNATTGVLMELGGYIRDIDVRVEHIEAKLGVAP